jgi:hypothetical protein
MINGKFGALGVETGKPSRMSIVLPGDIEPLKDEQGREAYIDFLPWDSEPGRKFDQEQQRDQVRKGFRQRSQAEQRADLENADIIKAQADRLAVLATGWHLVDPDGNAIDVPFSKSNALELFMTPELGWLRRNAWTYIGSERNFMKRSSKASAPSPSTNSGSTDQPEPAAPNATT